MDNTFEIYPIILKSNVVQKVVIKATTLKNNEKHRIVVIAKEEWDTHHSSEFIIGVAERKNIIVEPVNAVLEFSYEFIGEQEWIILLLQAESEKIIHSFNLYSLYDDLYAKTPYKGDLHIHTNKSDGLESPFEVALNYKKRGYDFICITDHHKYFSNEDAKQLFDKLEIKVFSGEEVHNRGMGYFHYVNFNSKYSVNEIILGNPEQVKKEVEKIKKDLNVPKNLNVSEIAWRIWIYNAIKKSGGLCIFPHPYWVYNNEYHTQTKISEYIFENNFFDIFEVLGGCTVSENNLQIALYNEQRANGRKIPIVGSTDSHSVKGAETNFDYANTIVFAENMNEIPNEIMKLNSVAVETIPNENFRIYGPFRLVKYAIFLMEKKIKKYKGEIL